MVWTVQKRSKEPERRLVTSTTDDNTEQVRVLITSNHQVTIDEVTIHLHISHGSAYEIVNKGITFMTSFFFCKKTLVHMPTPTLLNSSGLRGAWHPAKSSDHALSDCHLFFPLNDSLISRRLDTYQQVKEAMLNRIPIFSGYQKQVLKREVTILKIMSLLPFYSFGEKV